MTEAVPDQNPSYSYRASGISAPRVFRLASDALEWDAGRRGGRIKYGAIRRVRLSYRPSGMQSQRYLAEIWSSEAPKVTIYSVTQRGMFEQIRQDREYCEFLAALHARLNDRVELIAGLPFLMFWSGVVLFAAAALGLAALVVRAIQANAGLAALFIGAFLALFLWQAGNYFSRNRPGRYTADKLPADVMPKS